MMLSSRLPLLRLQRVVLLLPPTTPTLSTLSTISTARHLSNTARVTSSHKKDFWEHTRMKMMEGALEVPDDSDSDSDRMLARAIQLSLKEDEKGKKKENAIVISDDEEAGGGGGWETGKGRMSSMGMDRAQMERERLERLGRWNLVSVADEQKKPKPKPAEAPQKSTTSSSAASAFNREPPTWKKPDLMNLPFPGGVVKKTWALGQPRDSNTIQFEELLDPPTIYGAVLSAYQWDFEWVFSKIPSKKLQRFVLVIQAKTELHKSQYKELFGGFPGSDLVFPPMEEANAMHSKLMILFHRRPETGDNWMRIVVPSANLTSYDWGEGGTLENMVFVIDLPRLQAPKKSETQFATELARFCKEQGMPKDIIGRLHQYDYSATANMAFVHSIGGAHYEEDIRTNTGFPGLAKAIRTLGYASPKGLEIDYVTSSLGATCREFVLRMHNAALGCSGTLEALQRPPPPPPKKRGKKAAKSRLAPPPPPPPPPLLSPDEQQQVEKEEAGLGEADWESIKDRFRIYFPSHETVRRSFGGLSGAGTICFVENQWIAETFPQEITRDCESVRTGLVMHSKIMYVRPPVQIDTPGGKLDGWAYVGSANFSEAAWGKLGLNRAVAIPKFKLKCKNWECGVILPVFANTNTTAASGGQTLSGDPPAAAEGEVRSTPAPMEVFEDTVPVPMATPGVPLGRARPPWFYSELHSQRKRAEKIEEKKMKKRVRSESVERGEGSGSASGPVWKQWGRSEHKRGRVRSG